jgi:hypothetical protein
LRLGLVFVVIGLCRTLCHVSLVCRTAGSGATTGKSTHKAGNAAATLVVVAAGIRRP